MEKNFDKIIEFIFKWEGYKINDKDDSGGKTILGISSKYYPNEVKEMWEMSRSEAEKKAKEIYRRDYWNKIEGNNLENKYDAFLMDTAVNMGVTYANSLKKYSFYDLFFKRIEKYLEIASKKNNIKFLKGWISRVIDLYYFSKNL